MSILTLHQLDEPVMALLRKQAETNLEDRQATHSVFNGPRPTMITANDEADEIQAVGNWLRKLTTKDVPAQEIGVFVRSARSNDFR